MRLIFMDESGYTPDWTVGMEEQPFYVVSAVCIPWERCEEGYRKLREEIKALKLPGFSKPLGQGIEIKAKDIAKGRGWWEVHNEKRNKVRNLMLSFPKQNDGCAIVSIIDKKAHYQKYAFPASPYTLALQFVFERLQHYLSSPGVDDYGIVIYDFNARLESEISDKVVKLIGYGSYILKGTWIGLPFEFTLRIDRILEFAFGRSQNSVGLIVADFFSTMTYQYHKDGKPYPCKWWDLLWNSLYREGEKVEGYGYKLFP